MHLSSNSTVGGVLAALLGHLTEGRTITNETTGAQHLVDGTALPEPHVQQRRHRFQDLGDFAAFLGRHYEPTKADILFDGQQFVATECDQVEAPDHVSCVMLVHPRLQAWIDIVGRRLDQRTLYRFVAGRLQDFERIITRDGADGGSLGERFAGELRTLQVNRGRSFAAELDERGFYTARSSDEKTETTARIPSEVALVVPWWVGFDHGQFHLRLSVEMDVDDRGCPSFVLNWLDFDIVEHEARQEAVRELREALGEAWLVGQGVHRTEPVPLRCVQASGRLG